jgi:Mlc titration factor MtfA (ptsG expression regulator)
MHLLNRIHIRYILHRHPICHELWTQICSSLAILKGMTAVEKAHLRELTTLFLHQKKFVGAQQLQLTNYMCIVIAVQACLPVLKLGMTCLSGWTEIIIYPKAFRVARDITDSSGVVHHQEQTLIGESWSRGPLILSWQDVEKDKVGDHIGCNVVIHEIAHKLDVLNGSANGFPPLHKNMVIKEWSESLGAAYKYLISRMEHHHPTCINSYATTNPAEFFAVISEYFFCAPEILHIHFPDIYKQLTLYYRQDTLPRRQTS